jgi:hypothetical protein
MIIDYRSARFPLSDDDIRKAVILQARDIDPPLVEPAALNDLLQLHGLEGYP